MEIYPTIIGLGIWLRHKVKPLHFLPKLLPHSKPIPWRFRFQVMTMHRTIKKTLFSKVHQPEPAQLKWSLLPINSEANAGGALKTVQEVSLQAEDLMEALKPLMSVSICRRTAIHLPLWTLMATEVLP